MMMGCIPLIPQTPPNYVDGSVDGGCYRQSPVNSIWPLQTCDDVEHHEQPNAWFHKCLRELLLR